MDKINERLIEAFKEKGLTRYRVAQDLGLENSTTVDNWVVGKKDGKGRKFTIPSADNIAAICKIYEINPSWLLIGEGSQYKTQSITLEEYQEKLKQLVKTQDEVIVLKGQIDLLTRLIKDMNK